MYNFHIEVKKDEMDLSAYDALIANVYEAKENLTRVRETVPPRIEAEGREKFKAVMEQCVDLARRGCNLARIKPKGYGDAVYLRTDYGDDWRHSFCITCYNDDSYTIACFINGHWEEIDDFKNDYLAGDQFLARWNTRNIVGEMLKCIENEAKEIAEYYKEQADYIVKNEKDMLT